MLFDDFKPLFPENVYNNHLWQFLLNSKFLNDGESLSATAFSYRLDKTTVTEIIYETCTIIWETLRATVMPKPTKDQ
jgi:hypothetical protein